MSYKGILVSDRSDRIFMSESTEVINNWSSGKDSFDLPNAVLVVDEKKGKYIL